MSVGDEIKEYFMVDAIKLWLPVNRRKTPKGWEAMNCVMCEHMGKTPDTKRKGGIIFSGPTFTYRCFRCRFKAHFRPGMYMSKKLEKLLSVLGMDSKDINELKLKAMEVKNEGGFEFNEEYATNYENTLDFEPVELPRGSRSVHDLASEFDLRSNKDFINVINYIYNRGTYRFLNNIDFQWANLKHNKMSKRVILPFFYDGEIVGWTARYAGTPPDDTPKYYSQHPDGFLFNNQYLNDPSRRSIVLVEGPFDALSINGVAYMSNEPNQKQINWLNHSGKRIILLPDRAKSGWPSVNIAIENDWFVSFPDWDTEIKDANEAGIKYGSLWTTKSILDNAVKGETEILVRMKQWI